MSDVDKPTEEVRATEPAEEGAAPPGREEAPEPAAREEADAAAAPVAADGSGGEPQKKADRAERRERPARKREKAEAAPPPPHPLEAPMKQRFGDQIVAFEAVKGYCAAVVKPEDLVDVARRLQDESGYDHLRCISGIDRGERLEVAYNLMCLGTKEELILKVKLDRESPKVPSLFPLWKTADWQERETYDLFGIEFEGHPDLRRILLPDDWEGHPLRKDYGYR